MFLYFKIIFSITAKKLQQKYKKVCIYAKCSKIQNTLLAILKYIDFKNKDSSNEVL